MKIQEAIASGKNFKRKCKGMWLKEVNGNITTVEAMKKYQINTEDLCADDWEVEEKIPTSIEFDCIYCGSICEDVLYISNQQGDINFKIRSNFRGDVFLEERDIDKLLTFLYNNTEIGKSRITPF